MQNAGVPTLSPEGETQPRHGLNRRLGCALALVAVALATTGIVLVEGRTSYLQSRLFSKEASKLTFHLAPGASDSVFYPEGGPMDLRRGYSLIPEALTKLEAFDPKLSRLVELRYFGGLTLEETGEVLGTSTTAVWRDWNTARAWLYNELHGR